MDKKRVYCRYCGKLIDEDAPFCTYCGKKQGGNTKSSSIWNTVFHKTSTKLKYNGNVLGSIKKYLKRILVLVVVLIAVYLVLLLGSWLYGSHLASEWTKEDECREAFALKNINEAT